MVQLLSMYDSFLTITDSLNLTAIAFRVRFLEKYNSIISEGQLWQLIYANTSAPYQDLKTAMVAV